MKIGERLDLFQVEDDISTNVLSILKSLNSSFEDVCVPEDQRTTFHHINHIVRQFSGKLNNLIKSKDISEEEGYTYLEWMNYFMCEVFEKEYNASDFKSIFINIPGIKYASIEQ